MAEGNQTPEPTEQWIDLVPVKAVAKINLFERLREAERATKHPPHPVGAPPTRGVPWPLLAAVVGLAMLGLAAGWAFTRVGDKVPPAPSIEPSAAPSRRPTPSATPRFTPRPSATPVPGQTYTVQPGDTLITIGERLGKDWHAIAAANGNISDPNFITPGQVLRIP